MTVLPLEERVTILEMELNELKRSLNQTSKSPIPWWEQIAGTFTDDPAFEEAMRLGRQYREAQRPGESDMQADDVPA